MFNFAIFGYYCQPHLDILSWILLGCCHSTSGQKLLRLRYLLLDTRDQYRLEECCETYFRTEILPKLPKEFLESTVTVRWLQAGPECPTAVIFSNGKQRLWISSSCGGKKKGPVFWHRAV